MPVEFQRKTINIPVGIGRRTITDSVSFSSTVKRAGVALNGFELNFYPNIDRHINIIEVVTNLSSITAANTVIFEVVCEYADKNFDDQYRGFVGVLVIAEV